MCYFVGVGCNMDEQRSLDLASKSSRSGSKYGHFVLGEFMLSDAAEKHAQADAFYRLAAAQDLDAAKFSLGKMFHYGHGVPQDHAEALRLYQLAAFQGFPQALFNVALCHELGQGVRMDVEKARHWYRRAQAADHPLAVSKLQQLVYGDPVLRTSLPLALPVAGEGGGGRGASTAGCGWDMGGHAEIE
jgi:TPR repeat protein